MRNFFDNINRKLGIWMQGRNGADELSRATMGLVLILILLSAIPKLSILNTLAMVLLIWSMFRICSKNVYKRRAERDAWLRMSGSVKSWFRLQRRRFRERKDYKYFRCKQCKTVLRVPRGKGKVKIVCRSCGSNISGKT